MEHSILFELGIVLFLGFFAAILIKKLGQSVIVGYMGVGLLIGPNALKLIKSTDLINTLSELGIVFLMFFLGLEFSINKFKKIKNSVFFIGTYEVILNLLVGFIVGTAIGFSIKERLFLAGIIALSSSGVVAKLLFDMRRTANRESEILMGVMVYEDFFAIVILGILSSFVASDSVNLVHIGISIGNALIFYAVFILVGVLVINRFIDYLTRIESQELFTALMLGSILLIGALAAAMKLSSAAGAFLLGMIISSYDVEERLHRTVSAFKDIFLIVFFISFGMLLDPRQIPQVLWMVAIIVPVTIVGEILISSSGAFLSGFSAQSAVAIGSSMLARGEYSLIYATLGLGIGSATAKSLYQFTGVYVFVMTLIAPVAMKNAGTIRKFLSFATPSFIKYSAKLVSATLKPLLIPEESGVKTEKSYKFLVFFAAYLAIVIASILIDSLYILIPLALIGIAAVVILRHLFARKIREIEDQIHYTEIHEGPFSLDVLVRYISTLFSIFLGVIVLASTLWRIGFAFAAALLVVFLLALLTISLYVYGVSRKAAKI